MLPEREPKRICTVDCGAKCCRMAADVYLSKEEASRLRPLAEKRGTTANILPSMASEHHFYLKLSPQEPCAFLEGTLCGIHEERPAACRAYPLHKLNGCALSGWRRPPQVLLTAPRYRSENSLWRDSFEALAVAMQGAGIYGGKFIAQGVRVDDNRNAIGHYFLRETDADYVLMVDDDMTFHPDMVERLVGHGKPIVCGVYFQRGDRLYPHVYRYSGNQSDAYGEPAMFFEHPGEDFAALYDEYLGARENMGVPLIIEDMKRLVKVDAAGTGCCMIRRDVLEQTPYPWFRQEWGARGDLLFFMRAAAAGFGTWLDPGVVCGHLKQELVTLKDYLEVANAEG